MNDQEICQVVLAEKYLKDSETTADDIFVRVAQGVAQAEQPENIQSAANRFLQMMVDGSVGAGRIMSAAGTTIQATLINCFVQPVGDAIQGMDPDGYPGIYEALREAAETMRRGGGVGYDFSRIRPKGAHVKGTHSEASGPCSYINVFDQSCATVESAGSRRGAQMGVLRIDHPDVLEFITSKRTPGRWNNFNVSLFVEEDFFAALEADAQWELVHKAEPSERFKQDVPGVYQREDGKWVYRNVKASDLWDVVMKSNYDYAEPGILLGNNINSENNLWYCERLEATNPCAEQTLPPYGCCDLGPIILTKFVRQPFAEEASFDWDRFLGTAATMVRFLDNVLDVTVWPLPKQREESQAKRRIGVGFTGLGSALAMLGLKYGSHLGNAFTATLSERLRDAVYMASVELAKERGAFPALDKEKYLQGAFTRRLPEHIRDAIREHGIRNSHLLSIAPTGTVSLAFGDNCSNGIEPIFALAYKRKKRANGDQVETFDVVDHALRMFVQQAELDELGFRTAMLDAVCSHAESFEYDGVDHKVKDVLPDTFVTAQTLTVDQHLSVMAAVQPYVDSAISKTINVPADYPFEDFKAIYKKAKDLGLKGVACYRPNDILGSVLEVQPVKQAGDGPKDLVIAGNRVNQNEHVDPAVVVLNKRPKGDLDAVVKKVAYSGPDGESSMYLTVSFVQVQGVIGELQCETAVEVERPVEVFITASPDGVPAEWVNAYARSLSLLARAGVPLMAKALQDGRAVRSDKGRVRYGFYEKDDGTKVPRFHGSEVALIAFAVQEVLIAKGVLDIDGNPVPTRVRARELMPLEAQPTNTTLTGANPSTARSSKLCKECGAHSVIKKDGCDFCTNCGSIGTCG